MDRTCLMCIIKFYAVRSRSVRQGREFRRCFRRRSDYRTGASLARPSKHATNSLRGFRTRAGDRHAQIVKKQVFSLLDDFAAEVFETERIREMNKRSSCGFHVLSIARITTPVRILYDCFRDLALSFFMNDESRILTLSCRPAIEFYSVLQEASTSVCIVSKAPELTKYAAEFIVSTKYENIHSGRSCSTGQENDSRRVRVGAGRICFDPLADISKLTSALPR
jgi:hypothetical protein